MKQQNSTKLLFALFMFFTFASCSVGQAQASETNMKTTKVENTAEKVSEQAKKLESTLNKSSNTKETKNTMVIIKTSKGDIELALNAEKAPETVANFLSYIEDKHYDGTIFHRVIKGFMIQGGGFEPGLSQKPTKAPIVNEANNGLKNDKYTIAMARTSAPHSATAQFFINSKDNDFLNFTSETQNGWGYAVFGEVLNGKDVVDEIERVRTGNSNGFGDVPREDVVIESISVVE